MVDSIFKAYHDAYTGLSKEVWVLSIALLINRSGSMVLAFLTLYLISDLNFTITQAGAIFSVYGLGSIGGAWLGGRLIKPVGAVRFQIIALFVAAPLYCLVPVFTTWTGVACGIFMLSVCSEAIRPANSVAVTQFTPPEMQTRAFGLQRMAVNLGMSVGPAVGGVIAEFDFVLLFYVDGVTTALGGLYLLKNFGFKRYAKNDDAAEMQKLAEQNESKESPLRDVKFMCFLFLMLLVSIVFFQFHATYPKYLEDQYQLSKSAIGFVFAVNTIIIVIFEMLLLNGVRRFNLLRTIGWGSFLACIGFGILPASTAGWFVVFSMAIITVGEMLMFPVATGFTAQRSAGRDQGKYMSTYAMTYSFAAVIAPILGSSIYDVDPDLFWYISMGIGLVVLIGFYLLSSDSWRDTKNLRKSG